MWIRIKLILITITGREGENLRREGDLELGKVADR